VFVTAAFQEKPPMNNSVVRNQQSTILLVEDDDLVRDTITRILVREGYLVLTASTAHDAIGLLRTPSTSIDVMILDIGLPDVRGTDLCARVREILPNLPIVVCTGDADAAEVRELRQLGITRVFTKPLKIDALVSHLRASVAERS
jgi:DNA-binding response OmpR family regulator